MKKLPTDRQVLRAIFDEYESRYPGNKYQDGIPGPNDPYMEIDIPKIAHILHCRPELLHGILYFHMNEIYGYESGEKVRVSIFEKHVANKINCVNFPYLASKLAVLEEEFNKIFITRLLSVAAIILSAFALGFRVISMAS